MPAFIAGELVELPDFTTLAAGKVPAGHLAKLVAPRNAGVPARVAIAAKIASSHSLLSSVPLLAAVAFALLGAWRMRAQRARPV